MSMAQIVRDAKRRWFKRNNGARRHYAVACNVSASGDQDRIMKKVVGSAVLLHDDHNVLNLSARHSKRAATTGIEWQQNKHDCDQQEGQTQQSVSDHTQGCSTLRACALGCAIAGWGFVQRSD